MKVKSIRQIRELPGSCQASPIDAREVHHEGQIVQGGPGAPARDVWADESRGTACTCRNDASSIPAWCDGMKHAYSFAQ